MKHRRTIKPGGLLLAAGLLLSGIGAYPAIEPLLKLVRAGGFRALSGGQCLLLAAAGLALVLVAAYLILVSSPAFRRTLIPLTRLSVRVAVLLLLGLALYAAYESHGVAFAGTALAALCFSVWAWALAARTLPVIWARQVVDEHFPSGGTLRANWDEVHPGTPTRILNVSDQALGVRWAAGQPYDESGYLLKRLPPVDLRVDAELEPRVYGAGWDPGIHFYPRAGNVYCLSLGFIPQGHGPADFAGYDGLYVRTDTEPRRQYFEHTRIAAAPGARVTVAVEVRGTQALVKIGEQVFPVQLPCRPEELVVGCWKWLEPGGRASRDGEHLIHSVKVMRI